jgi:hypothetical protein
VEDRATPDGLSRAWEEVTHDPNPVGALRATATMHRELIEWQSVLVAEAIDAGATWENVGAALGTTRQAAWARFRHVVEDDGRRTKVMNQQANELLKRVQDEMKSLHARTRELDGRWREERARLHREGRDAAHRMQQERNALRQELKETTRALREEVRRLKTPPGPDESAGEAS